MIMNIQIEKMLSHVYEIEGLMLVTRRLGEENTPDVITNKIQRKVRELAAMCGVELTTPQQPEPVPEPAPEPAPVAAPEPAPEAEPVPEPEPEPVAQAEHLPEDDYDADETWQHDNGEEFKEVFALDYKEPEHETVVPGEVPVADREPDEDITVEWIEADEEPAPVEEPKPAPVAAPVPPVQPPLFRDPEMINDEPVPEPDPAILPEAADEPDITVEFIEAEDDNKPLPENEQPLPPVPTDFPIADDEQLRVDQKLQRHLSRDIRKAFSVNDRFRFQRELFAGSANAMNTAIEHIEMMRSYGNAELYFFSQLHWDRDNEVVKDFMAIVRNHYQQ
jgi:hypothetical protein